MLEAIQALYDEGGPDLPEWSVNADIRGLRGGAAIGVCCRQSFSASVIGGPMLKVYSYFNSICTQKVFITLAEKGIAYTTQNVDLFRNEQFLPAYLKINPKGVVPALDHDGRIVIESTLRSINISTTFSRPRLRAQKGSAARRSESNRR